MSRSMNLMIEGNKHTESIAKAIQVPHRPQQIQICNHYFGALLYRQEKSWKQILNKGQYLLKK